MVCTAEDMRMNNDLNNSAGIMANPMMTFVCGVLVGAAVGTAVALLYAPMSGQDTRGQIMEKANDLKDSAVDWKDRAVDSVSEWKDRAVSAATDTLDKASESIKSANDGMEPRNTRAVAKV